MLRIKIIFLITFITVFSGSCAYRFTNLHVQVPQGIRTISIEAVYDTGQQVLPHQILWEALQAEFATDGHLRLVSQGRSDAVLRAHITQAIVSPTGSTDTSTPEKDENKDTKPAPAPKDFRQMSRAGEYTSNDVLSFTVNVDVINLYTKQKIFEKKYSGTSKFHSLHKIQDKTQFLFYEEALQTHFKRISKKIAKNVVRDFVVGR